MPVRLGRPAISSNWISTQLSFSDPLTKDAFDCIPWVDRFSPKNESELCIHRDKLKELESTIASIFLETTRNSAPILILSGPAGSGKTSALRVLITSSLCFKFANSVHFIEWNSESLDADEMGQLEEFVLQSGRYGYGVIGPENPTPCTRYTVCSVENFPVSAAEHPGRIHDMLRRHHKFAQPTCLLVVHFTTSSSSNEGLLCERVLCPPSLRSELDVKRVEFNPIAPSLVLKALSRVATESMSLQTCTAVPPRSLLQHISSGCGGDLRTAINQLQFLAISGWTNTSIKPDGGRDVGLIVFRLLGKIFYNKREATNVKSTNKTSIAHSLPPHLFHWRRDPLSFNVEDTLGHCGMSGDQVIPWLFENFIDFTPNMTATHWSSDHFSWTDAYLSGGMNWRLGLTAAAMWNENGPASADKHYAALAMVRSLLLSHGITEETQSSPAASIIRPKKFYQFRPPSKQDAWKVVQTHMEQLRNCSRSNLNAQFVITGSHRMLLERLPCIPRIPCEADDQLRYLSSLCCEFGQSSHLPPAKRPKLQSNVADDEWICPPDAVAEGNDIPIEEDVSDDTERGKGL